MSTRIRTFSLTAGIAAAILAAVNIAQAQPGPDGKRAEKPGGPPSAKQLPSADEIFSRLDKDKDGKVTLEEFKAGHERMREQFHQRFQAARGERFRGPGKQGPPRRGPGAGFPGRPGFKHGRGFAPPAGPAFRGRIGAGFGARGPFGAGLGTRGPAAQRFLRHHMQGGLPGGPGLQGGFYGQSWGGPSGFHPGFRQGPPPWAPGGRFGAGFGARPPFGGPGAAPAPRDEKGGGPSFGPRSRMHSGMPDDRQGAGGRESGERGHGPGPKAGPGTPAGPPPGAPGLGPRRPEGPAAGPPRGTGRDGLGPDRGLDRAGQAQPPHRGPRPGRGPEAGGPAREEGRRPAQPDRPRGEEPRPQRPDDGRETT